MKSYFLMFAHYNAWANRRLYDAAARLSSEDLRADRGAFFGSVLRTLNHVLVADRIWMHRFTGRGETYTRLDLVLHEDFEDLRRERQTQDQHILAWLEALDESKLSGSFTYRTIVNPSDVTQPVMPALAHFFNHQTHHRGQVHAILTGIAGRDSAPSLDLIYFQRETGIGLTA